MLLWILKIILLLLILLSVISLIVGFLQQDYFFVIVAILIAFAVWILILQIRKMQYDPFR